jgi:hypothetical protein
MSERGEVEVLLPLNRIPTKAEQKDLLRTAFEEARKLVAPTQGRVLGPDHQPTSSQGALRSRGP